MNDLDFIEPLRIMFTIDARDIEVSPIVVRELPALLRLAEPIMGELMALPEAMLSRLEAGKPNLDDLNRLMHLVVTQGDRVVDALALCSRQPADWVGGLLPDRAAQLLAVCIQVNLDFFSRAMPGLRALAVQLKPVAAPKRAADPPAAAPAMPAVTPTRATKGPLTGPVGVQGTGPQAPKASASPTPSSSS